jgi:ubiquinone/menaquinone biosynthesis C-methylase UbiE
MKTPKQLKEHYDKGENIITLLRNEYNTKKNTSKIIELSYDMQSGSYVNAMKNNDISSILEKYSKEITRIMLSYCQPESILEAGVGEATTLSGVIKNLDSMTKGYGFDLSWSRIACGKRWLEDKNIKNVELCTGDLFNIPYQDNSIDIVYTSHSIEPNGGNEKPILQELFRVTKKYLILLEPSYELSNTHVQERMNSHGYCKNIKGLSESLGFKVIKHELFPYTTNKNNPTAITVIEKLNNSEKLTNVYACPEFKKPLKHINGTLFSPEALVAYPILGGIPCLKINNGIFASKFEEYSETMTHSSSSKIIIS